MAKKPVISTYKAHETRMWIKDVIVPTVSMAVCGAMIFHDPDIRQGVKDWGRDTMAKVAYRVQTIKDKVFHK